MDEYTKEERELMATFIEYVAQTPVDKYPADRYRLACDSYWMAEKAWLKHNIYCGTGIAILLWYQNELSWIDEKGNEREWYNKEWRPAIIMRTVLESAGLYMETLEGDWSEQIAYMTNAIAELEGK